MSTRGQTPYMTIAEGGTGVEDAARALIAEARRRVRPLDLTARRLADSGFAVDLIADGGSVRVGTMASVRVSCYPS